MASMARLRTCCERMERKVQAEADLSEAQCAFLAVIPADRPINTGDVCRAVGLSPSRGSRVIEDLAQRGLVMREPDPADRRIALVVLTPAGKQFKRLELLLDRCEEVISNQLSDDETATVQAGLALLLRVKEKV